MAKNYGTYVIVEKGDVLWKIARDYGNGLTYTQLAAINNIPDPNKIYVGQKIMLSGVATGTSSGSSSSTSSANQNQAVINQFGLQSDTDNQNVLFATWTWSKASTTESYQISWEYNTGDGVWFISSSSNSVDEHNPESSLQSTFTIPGNAIQVRFKVKPVAKPKSSKNTETRQWSANWTSYKVHTVENPPETPTNFDVQIEDYLLTFTVYDLDTTATHLDLQIVKNDLTLFKTATPSVKTIEGSDSLEDGASKYVRYTCYVDAGAEYKVRCRAVKDTLYSDWSGYSSNVRTIPAVPSEITTCKANSETSVYLEWTEVSNADSYDIEYAIKKTYFDGSNATIPVNDIEFTHFEIVGLEIGQEYFFRVRAVNDKGESGWSDIVSVVLGKEPEAPTTWSSTTTVIVGEPLNLYWVHNCEDGSSETYAELELTIGGATETHTIKKSTDEEEKDKTSVYSIDTSEYSEGVDILWRVRTAGITKAYGDWSVQRTVDIYAPPTLELNLKDKDGNVISVLDSFPLYISALAGPKTQVPIGYHVAIKSNEIYETVDSIGNRKIVNNGEEVYSVYYDTNDPLLLELTASSIDLENNISYTAQVIVSMDSGLTVEETYPFTVSWTDAQYQPNAEITFDKDLIVTYVRPYCDETKVVFYKVNNASGVYTTTTDVVEMSFGVPVEEGEEITKVYTETGEQVFSGTTVNGEEIFYCTKDEVTRVSDVLLSVYRREFDGSFTQLATGIDNSQNTFVTDPHPALDYARYRIVATTESTGAVSYYDVPGYFIDEHAVIIQWNEDWTNFNTTSEDEQQQPPWSGSLLRLPYNIRVSDKYSPDVQLVEYIGRKHPVTYYGTQIGETSTWNVDIDREDVDTLYALRRLAIWMGDVYVREPSGSGYWANISVSFNQSYSELTIPVTLDITRVEGGM